MQVRRIINEKKYTRSKLGGRRERFFSDLEKINDDDLNECGTSILTETSDFNCWIKNLWQYKRTTE